MTSRTFLVEVTEDGHIITGELYRVTRTISSDTAEPGVRRIRLEGVIISTTVEQDPAAVLPKQSPGSRL